MATSCDAFARVDSIHGVQKFFGVDDSTEPVNFNYNVLKRTVMGGLTGNNSPSASSPVPVLQSRYILVASAAYPAVS